jgi:hypothetical protein
MTIIEITSLVLSATVVIVAGITAIVSYLNYKAITTFTLYLRAETKEKTVGKNDTWFLFPDRILNTLVSNQVSTSNPQVVPITVRWFDVILGNTGPGVARKITWKVQYSPEGNKDFNDMHSQETFDLGPQANVEIVRYLPKDYSTNINRTFFSEFTFLPNPSTRFPWIVEVCFEVPRFMRKNLKVQEEHSISADGTVRKKKLNEVTKQSGDP